MSLRHLQLPRLEGRPCSSKRVGTLFFQVRFPIQICIVSTACVLVMPHIVAGPPVGGASIHIPLELFPHAGRRVRLRDVVQFGWTFASYTADLSVFSNQQKKRNVFRINIKKYRNACGLWYNPLERIYIGFDFSWHGSDRFDFCFQNPMWQMRANTSDKPSKSSCNALK